MNYELSKQSKDFIAETVPELIANGITVKLYKDRFVPQGYSGQFCDRKMLFESALGKDTEAEAFAIYMHEYNHFRQWIEKDPVWDFDEEHDILEEWYEGKTNLTPEQAREQCLKALAVEVDCEKRTTKMIKDRGISIDTLWYTRKANAYLFFYPCLAEIGKWTTVPPYEIPEIVDMMPYDYLDTAEDYFDLIPDGYMELLKEKCYGEKK
jgi:hypothetical protein